MSLSKSSFAAIPACFATVSVGTPNHPLQEKIEAIASAGFQGLELGFPDLLNFASGFHRKQVGNDDFPTLCEAAKQVKAICEFRDVKIVMLQPFAHFEGWKPHSEERKDAFRRAEGWIQIMQALGCDMLQVGSTDSPDVPACSATLASDLGELADMLAKHNFHLAYENWCWATHAPNWKHVWDLVQKVNRANVGLCLDTFQIAGGEWADPTTNSGLLECAGSRTALEKQFRHSLGELADSVPMEQIYILQISDAYKPHQPLDPGPDKTGMRPRARWSSCLRPVPFDGGYLPVVEVTKAVLNTGFRGWFSMEVFDGGSDGCGQDWSDMSAFTKKAMASHKRLLDEAADCP